VTPFYIEVIGFDVGSFAVGRCNIGGTEALSDFKRAMDLNPASALTSQGHAVALMALNRPMDACINKNSR
jgi:hypothetical protein